eukprot:g3775.t1
MKVLLSTRYVTIPESVKLTAKCRTVHVYGPRGHLNRQFKYRNVEFTRVGTDKLRVDVWFGRKKDISCIRTITAHIENMITGVTKGYEYKMRAVYNHFPINLVIASENRLEIRNFLGERRVRVVEMPKGVTIAKADDVKDQLVISGIDIEAVSHVCSDINMITKVKRKDIRKFLDGIYIEVRGNIEKEE